MRGLCNKLDAPVSTPIYLDHAATTPVDARVLEAMLPYFSERFGNASSRQHAAGRAAQEAVEEAREKVAALLGADPREIVFTSGATESNNLLLKGVAGAEAYAKTPRHVVTACTEHHAVLDPLGRLEAENGFEVTRLSVDEKGAIDLDQLRDLLNRKPRLVTLMHANNELGSLHPIDEIGALCRAAGVLFHTDAAQSFGKEAIDVDAFQVDALSLSGHKLYAPKGVGVLYLRRRRPRVRCQPLFDGGGHERGARSGTLNVPGIVALGAAAEICSREMEADGSRIGQLRDRLELGLIEGVGGIEVNGDRDRRLAGLTNLSIEGISAESLLTRLDGVMASTSAACTSASLQPSHVLRAIGCDPERVEGSIRLSLGRSTSPVEVDSALEALIGAIDTERREGPRDLCELG
ncbi:MAG: cysteine desulfurase [Planctomycetota bacterium]